MPSPHTEPILNLFFGSPQLPRCHKLRQHQFCHVHDQLRRGHVLFWTMLSTSLSLFLFVLSMGAKKSGYVSTQFLTESQALLPNITQNSELPVILLFVLLVIMVWLLCVTLVCSRRFTCISEYVWLALASPFAVLHALAPQL